MAPAGAGHQWRGLVRAGIIEALCEGLLVAPENPPMSVGLDKVNGNFIILLSGLTTLQQCSAFYPYINILECWDKRHLDGPDRERYLAAMRQYWSRIVQRASQFNCLDSTGH